LTFFSPILFSFVARGGSLQHQQLRQRLARKLLSAQSSRHLLGVVQQTLTFPDRLRAGTAPRWTIGHKTGTGGAWNGVNTATNDVGVLGAPDAGAVAVLMAKIAAAAIACYR
jgi:beta-lactamase class A